MRTATVQKTSWIITEIQFSLDDIYSERDVCVFVPFLKEISASTMIGSNSRYSEPYPTRVIKTWRFFSNVGKFIFLHYLLILRAIFRRNEHWVSGVLMDWEAFVICLYSLFFFSLFILFTAA